MELRPQDNPQDPDLLEPDSRIQKQKTTSRPTKTYPKPFYGKDKAKTCAQDAHQMFTAMILDTDPGRSLILKRFIDAQFPEISILALADDLKETRNMLLSLRFDLIFCDAARIKGIKAMLYGIDHPEFILMSKCPEDAIRALRHNMCGFISIPLDEKEVAISLRSALDKMIRKRRAQKVGYAPPLPHTNMVGVPTMEGIEFMDTRKIVRCEGLQKCTLIITTEKSDIISSYSIGKFEDLLEGHGFFSCHRSHFINLKFVKKYTKEGYIFFSANSKPVPLARRRKCDFLKQIKHL